MSADGKNRFKKRVFLNQIGQAVAAGERMAS